MIIYLDNCSLQRPLDNKIQVRIRLEAEAKIAIIELLEKGKIRLAMSTLLEYELQKTPDPDRISFGNKVLSLSSNKIVLSKAIIDRAKDFTKQKIKPIDALHLAIAVIKEISYLCTCDDRFLKRANKIGNLKTQIVSPLQFIQEFV